MAAEPGTDPVPFNPDWTIAPAATLREWMEQNDVDRLELIARCDPGGSGEHAEAVVGKVLAREPVTALMAAALERGTGIPARAWLRLEGLYRADLAAGRKDTTPEDGDR
jgi:hypothetical protein